MSDQSSTPPRPKPGSLRDRIAAFENKAAAATSPPGPPPPRPKPAGFATWKPKPPSPPATPPSSGAISSSNAVGNNDDEDNAGVVKTGGGMSVNDAKESIVKGGSLKERMAALQGRGAFAAPASVPVPAPKPKPKPQWKPPIAIPTSPPPSADDKTLTEGEVTQQGDHEGSKPNEAPINPSPPRPSSASASTKSPEPDADNSQSVETRNEDGGHGESESSPAGNVGSDDAEVADPEEEERQRRSAIAARMAKLGGARIGMGPPMFAARPAIPVPARKPSLPKERTEEVSPPIVTASSGIPAHVEKQPDDVSPPAAASEPETTSASTSPRPPSSMPAPAVPRRAAPPRRKAPAKAPSLEPEPGAEAPPEPEVIAHEQAPDAQLASEMEAQEPSDTRPEKVTVQGETLTSSSSPEMDMPTDEGIDAKPRKTQPDKVEGIEEKQVQDEAEADEKDTEEVEEDEEARRQRVAEKLAQMGAVNPFSLPSLPPRKFSDTSIPEKEVSVESAEPLKKEDKEHEDVASTITPESLAIPAPGSGHEEANLGSSGEVNEFPGQAENIAPSMENVTEKKQRKGSVDIENDDKQGFSDDDRQIKTEAHDTHRDVRDGNEDIIEVGKESEVRSQEGSHVHARDEFDVSPPPKPIRLLPILPSAASTSGDATNDVPPPSPREPPRRVVSYPPRIASDQEDNQIQRKPPGGGGEDITSGNDESDTPVEIEGSGEAIDAREGQEGVEDEYNSDLARSTLFVPPPHASATGEGKAFRTCVLEDEQEVSIGGDEGKGQEPLRVPPRIAPANQVEEESSNSEPVAVPIAVPQPVPVPVSADRSDGHGHVPTRSIPPPPQIGNAADEKEEDTDSVYNDEEEPKESGEKALYVRSLKNTDSSAIDEEAKALLIPPPQEKRSTGGENTDGLGSEEGGKDHKEYQGIEVLDEEEGDPIDPAFHSPIRPVSKIDLKNMATRGHIRKEHEEAKTTTDDKKGRDDETEMARKQTLSERISKLSGIQLGIAPEQVLPIPRKRDRSEGEQNEGNTKEGSERLQEEGRDKTDGDQGKETDEDERARRERIAAKLAGMGGMRIGMMPMARPPPRSHILRGETEEGKEKGGQQDTTPSLPTRVAPPVQSLSQPSVADRMETDSEKGSVATSEEGVKIDPQEGESEAEELEYEDVHEDEVPPPVPDRGTRGHIHATSPPHARPPVPEPYRRMSGQNTGSAQAKEHGARKSLDRQHSEFVMVDEPEPFEEMEEKKDEAPPPPPGRFSHRSPPIGAAPPVPRDGTAMHDSISSQWELPAIPSALLELDSTAGGDLAMSWSEASVDEFVPPSKASLPAPTAPPSTLASTKSPETLQLSTDELMATWGRVGVQVCEIATTLYDKSKKSLIGDGSYRGFVDIVLAQVPTASRPTPNAEAYGYLVYMQNGSSVQRRVSEIMPGDIAELVDAKFKGHKGLQGYSMHVGATGEGGNGPVVGIVNEFEVKKSKVKVFQANQHVGQQTVESVTYRLEDLKSGMVKIYRVLEAY